VKKHTGTNLKNAEKMQIETEIKTLVNTMEERFQGIFSELFEPSGFA
jgi:hypothetical protein